MATPAKRAKAAPKMATPATEAAPVVLYRDTTIVLSREFAISRVDSAERVMIAIEVALSRFVCSGRFAMTVSDEGLKNQLQVLHSSLELGFGILARESADLVLHNEPTWPSSKVFQIEDMVASLKNEWTRLLIDVIAKMDPMYDNEIYAYDVERQTV